MTSLVAGNMRASSVAGGVLVIMAVALQISIDVPLWGVPLRLTLADALLPVALPLLTYFWIRDVRRWPQSRLAALPLWLAALTGWIIISILLGRLATGEWIVWAVVHRGIGWLALLGYLVLGLMATALASEARNRNFVAVFAMMICVGVLCSWISLIATFLRYESLFGFAASYRTSGLMQNPNAFGILAATAAALMVGMIARDRYPLGRIWSPVVLGIVCVAACMPQSRSGWLALLGGAVAVVLFARIPKRTVLIAIGTALATWLLWSNLPLIAYAGQHISHTLHGLLSAEQNWTAKQIHEIDPLIARPLLQQDGGVLERLAMTRKALEMWREQPILGIGLGVYYHQELVAKGTTYANTLHTSLLWILVEMGLIGAALFCVFGMLIFLSLRRSTPTVPAGRELGVFLALVALAAASIGTDVLYQRYLWFLLGWGLAVPVWQWLYRDLETPLRDADRLEPERIPQGIIARGSSETLNRQF